MPRAGILLDALEIRAGFGGSLVVSRAPMVAFPRNSFRSALSRRRLALCRAVRQCSLNLNLSSRWPARPGLPVPPIGRRLGMLEVRQGFGGSLILTLVPSGQKKQLRRRHDPRRRLLENLKLQREDLPIRDQLRVAFLECRMQEIARAPSPLAGARAAADAFPQRSMITYWRIFKRWTSTGQHWAALLNLKCYPSLWNRNGKSTVIDQGPESVQIESPAGSNEDLS